VLYHYAICGIVLFVFRRLQPKYLVMAAAFCLLAMTAVENKNLYREKAVIRKGD
jgi:uncharacterized membrane protein YeiB